MDGPSLTSATTTTTQTVFSALLRKIKSTVDLKLSVLRGSRQASGPFLSSNEGVYASARLMQKWPLQLQK